MYNTSTKEGEVPEVLHLMIELLESELLISVREPD